MLRSLSVWLLGGLLAPSLCSQGLWIGPQPVPPDQGIAPPPHVPTPAAVRIVRSAVRAEIVDGVATTRIEQVYRNDGGREAEGTWMLPLPSGAVADGFEMTVDGKKVAGEVLDAGQARAVYEQIVRQRRDPGLLEFAGEGLLRARIYPIPAHGEVGVAVRLRAVLQPNGGLYEWRWPLRAARLGDAPSGPVSLEVTIRSRTPLASVLAPYATASIRRIGDREAHIGYEGGAEGDDLRVVYGLSQQDFGLNLLPYRDQGNAGYFAMLVAPPRELGSLAPPRRCVQFVVDTSGSMAGEKMDQAKAALRAFLASLRPSDCFQIVAFASNVQPFFEAPQPASAENVTAALRRVEQLQAAGGTNIGEALRTALENVPPAGDGPPWLCQVVFVTDGEPTVGVIAPNDILALCQQSDRRQQRLFALGVGADLDVRLLDDLVLQHRGARDFVRRNEKIEVKVDALCQKLGQPALTDVEVAIDGLDAFDVHPTRTRDLFCGEVLQVVGRYRDSGMRTVRVRGKQNGAPREFVFEVEFPALAGQHGFVPTLWARQHVAALLDAIRRNGAKGELVAEVKRLATQYGIVTPFTSQLIVEERERLAGHSMPGLHFVSAEGAPAGPATGGGPATPGAKRRGAPASAPAAPPALDQFGRARSGEAAVAESLSASADDAGGLQAGFARVDRGGEGNAKDQPTVQQAGGRTFVRVGDEWVEQGLPDGWQKHAVLVALCSEEWFALARQDAKLRAILALGERVVFHWGAQLLRVGPAAPTTGK